MFKAKKQVVSPHLQKSYLQHQLHEAQPETYKSRKIVFNPGSIELVLTRQGLCTLLRWKSLSDIYKTDHPAFGTDDHRENSILNGSFA